MDTDGSGGIEFSEFVAWWKADAVRSQSKTHMALLKMKLRGQALVGHLTGGILSSFNIRIRVISAFSNNEGHGIKARAPAAHGQGQS